jgi:ABC-2 type transport system permease protein
MPTDRQARADALALEPMRPAGCEPGLIGGTLASIRDLVAHRQLMGQLTRREIKARYKDSALGLIWSLIRPLVQMLIYWLALGRFLGAERGIPSFAIFIFAGLTAWGLFSDIVTTGTASIVANSGLIKKVYLPREVFPLAAVGSALFNFAMQMVILFGFAAVRGQFPTGTRLLYGLYALVVCVVFATALALLFAAVNVYLRDVQYLVEICIMMFFWLSPIVYSVQMAVGQLENLPAWITRIYLANPMTIVVLAFQQAFWTAGDTEACNPIDAVCGAEAADPVYYCAAPVNSVVTDLVLRLSILAAGSVMLLWIAHRVFARLQANFAQEL